MCDTIIYQGKEIDTVAKFKATFGTPIKDDLYERVYDDNSCLCQIDISASFLALGIVADYDGLTWRVRSQVKGNSDIKG